MQSFFPQYTNPAWIFSVLDWIWQFLLTGKNKWVLILTASLCYHFSLFVLKLVSSFSFPVFFSTQSPFTLALIYCLLTIYYDPLLFTIIPLLFSPRCQSLPLLSFPIPSYLHHSFSLPSFWICQSLIIISSFLLAPQHNPYSSLQFPVLFQVHSGFLFCPNFKNNIIGKSMAISFASYRASQVVYPLTVSQLPSLLYARYTTKSSSHISAMLVNVHSLAQNMHN